MLGGKVGSGLGAIVEVLAGVAIRRVGSAATAPVGSRLLDEAWARNGIEKFFHPD
jgi:hypothetical protein